MPTFTALLTLTTIFPLPTDIICTFVRNLLTKMTENRSYLQKYAMHFGTYMGIYWILKFILFPLGFHIPFLSLLFVILTLAVPFIGYHYVKMYRDKICGGSIQFSHAVLFTIFMYMFASLLVAVAHYAYFQFIDHGFIINSYIQLWDELMTKTPALMENQEIIKEIEPQNLIMMGDSAGGGLALALEEKLGEENIEVPEKLILISPWLDTTMTNPKIDKIQENDKDLSKEKLKIAGILYSGEKENSSYLVNPINGPINKLKNVTIYTGTYDILNPDAKDFVEKAKNEEIQITLKEYEKASHIWILKNQDELATKAYEDLIIELKK